MNDRTPDAVRPPSGAAGVALAWRLRRLVAVLWIADQLLALPAWAVAVAAIDGRLGGVADPWTGDGEALVVAMELLTPVAWPFGLAVVGTLISWWAWNVLWRGGVVTWAVWGSSRAVRVSELVGHGLLRWWRFARLHLAAALLGVSAVAALGWAVAEWTAHLARDRGEGVAVAGWAVTVTLGVVVIGALGAAAAAGCWHLGRPGVRSAFRSLWHGLRTVGRHPLRSLALVAGWWSLAFVAALAPVWLALTGSTGVLVMLAFQLGAMLRAMCRVGLLGTFVPALGIAADNLSDG